MLPTILEAAGIPEPVEVDGVKQQRVDGVSMLVDLRLRHSPEQAHHAVLRDAGKPRDL